MKAISRNLKSLLKKYTGYHNPNLPDISKLNPIQNSAKKKKI